MKSFCLVVFFLGLVSHSLSSQSNANNQKVLSKIENELKNNYRQLIDKLVVAFNRTGLDQYLQDVNGEITVNLTGLAANMTALNSLFQPKANGNCPLVNQILVHLKNSTILNSFINALNSSGYGKYVTNNNNVESVNFLGFVQDTNAVQAVINYYMQQGVIPASGVITLSANIITYEQAIANNMKNFPFLSQFQI